MMSAAIRNRRPMPGLVVCIGSLLLAGMSRVGLAQCTWQYPSSGVAGVNRGSGCLVGINTTDPQGQLHIFGNASSDLFAGMGPNLFTGPAFNFGYAGQSFGEGAGFFNSRPSASAIAPNPSLRFLTGNVERMIVTNTGSVGIGTSNPSAKLQVIGDAVFNGTVTGTNIRAQYQDLAEWVPSRDPLSAGTVVIVDPEMRNGVTAASRPYDTRVAGVVASQPGFLLGEAGAGKVMVATTGRVLVKADASHQAIRVGDLLVTSDREGHAMKSEPLNLGSYLIHRPGTVLGKALEPLEQGHQGQILVLLSLQ